MLEMLAYIDGRGRSPFDVWLDRLAPAVQNRIHQVLMRMAQGNLGDIRSVGDEVIERRIHFGPGYRIYFAWDGSELIILLGGGGKSNQSRDIANAKVRWRDYQTRMNRGERL